MAKQSTRPKSVEPTLNAPTCERLQHILHQSPRIYGKPTGRLDACLGCPGVPRARRDRAVLSDETIRRALATPADQLEAGQTLDHES